MTANQRNNSLKKEFAEKNFFDMESLLTRAVYRVLTENKERARPTSNARNNVEKLNTFPSQNMTVARVHPRLASRPIPAAAGNVQLQMQLLAQQLVGKLERRYEKRINEAREADRVDTEKRLAAIRSEYEAKQHAQKILIRKERERLAEQLAEHERSLEHRFETRISDREADVEMRRRTIENKSSELQIGREQLERAKEAFARKMDSEMQEVKLERQRLTLLETESSSQQKSDAFLEHELSVWKRRASDLELELNTLRQKFADALTENFRLKDENANIQHVKSELSAAVKKLDEEREELSNMRMEMRRTGDYDSLRTENVALKAELEAVRQHSKKAMSETSKQQAAEFGEREKRLHNVVNEAKVHAAMAMEKSRELEMERDILRNELKSLQKLAAKNAFAPSAKFGQDDLGRSRKYRAVSPDESSSSPSDGELEILNIRQRIQNLGEIAKELDASVEHFSMLTHPADEQRQEYARGATSEQGKIEMYDDFCRALNVGSEHKTSSPQKKYNGRSKKDDDEAAEESEAEARSRYSKDVIKTAAAEDSRDVTPTRRTPAVDVEREAKKMSPRDEPPPLTTSSIEDRLRSRSSAKQNVLLQLADGGRRHEELKGTSDAAETAKSAENPMFAGVDPVMAQYMQRVMQSKQQPTQSEVSGGQRQPAKSLAKKSEKEVEVTYSDEIDLDAGSPKNSDFEW